MKSEIQVNGRSISVTVQAENISGEAVEKLQKELSTIQYHLSVHQEANKPEPVGFLQSILGNRYKKEQPS